MSLSNVPEMSKKLVVSGSLIITLCTLSILGTWYWAGTVHQAEVQFIRQAYEDQIQDYEKDTIIDQIQDLNTRIDVLSARMDTRYNRHNENHPLQREEIKNIEKIIHDLELIVTRLTK